MAIVAMAQLDDFRATPQSQKAFEDLKVASAVWAALVRDERAKSAWVPVTATTGGSPSRRQRAEERWWMRFRPWQARSPK